MRTRRPLALLVSAILGACATPPPAIDDRPPPRSTAGAPTLYSAAVAADHALASRAGAQMLQLGGNAVDAVVAAAFTLSVVRPQSCGIGGGGFILIFLPPGSTRDGATVCTAIDSREWCPEAVTERTFVNANDRHASTVGGLAVAVPGTVAGLLHAQERYGRLDRPTVLAPAVSAAREGFEADAAYMAAAAETIARFTAEPSLQARFPFLWNTLLKHGGVHAGDRIANPDQAAALERIAQRGVPGFYNGETADRIVDAVRASGGVMTVADLAAYASRGMVERAPLRSVAFGRTVLSMPPPSSGGVALSQTLMMMDDLRRAGGLDGDGAYAHALVECFKLTFADRAAFMADPDFKPAPLQMLLNADDALRRAHLIDPDQTQPPEHYTRQAPPGPAPIDHGTSHVSAADRWGGACACTQTINLFFGSYVCPEGCGFLLNNEMDDFTTRPGAPNAFGLIQATENAPQPRKRPLSSMTPTIVLDSQGRVEAVAGASGGPRIITATAQAILNVIIQSDDAAAAVARPRLHHQWSPNVLRAEPELPDSVRHWLAARGHLIESSNGEAAVQLIARSSGGTDAEPIYTAASDPRKGGQPAGVTAAAPSSAVRQGPSCR